jgi:amino acid transporter
MSDTVIGDPKYGADEEKGTHRSNGSNGSPDPDWATVDKAPKEPWTRRFVDSFKRDPNATVILPSQATTKGGFDHAAAAQRTANSGLAHKLKGRHMCVSFKPEAQLPVLIR